MSVQTFRHCFLNVLIALGSFTVGAIIPPDLRDGLMLLNETAFRGKPDIDPRFSISSEYGRPALPGIPCLMNAINTMQDWALEDFEEPLVPATYVLDSFPEVMIAAEATALGGAVQTRFMVWGLWVGIIAMTERRTFQTAVFTLKYEGNTVGYLKIARPGAMSFTIDSNGTGTPTQESADRHHALEVPTATAQMNDHSPLSVSFTPIGPALTAQDVLLVVLYGLVYTAHFPASQKVEPFELKLPAPYFMNIKVSATSTTPSPMLENRWVINSLSQIPGYMLVRKGFSGVWWRMDVDGISVGDGQIFRQTPASKAMY